MERGGGIGGLYSIAGLRTVGRAHVFSKRRNAKNPKKQLPEDEHEASPATSEQETAASDASGDEHHSVDIKV